MIVENFLLNILYSNHRSSPHLHIVLTSTLTDSYKGRMDKIIVIHQNSAD